MEKIMKKITGLVVVLAALILGGYYGMGVMTERALRKNIDTINRTEGVHAELSDYQRGWFRSHAKLDWKVRVPQQVITTENGETTTIPAKDFDTAMPLTIWHGPVIFANGLHFGLGYAQSRLELPTQLKESFKSTFTSESVEPSLNLVFFVEYTGATRVDGDAPAFSLVTTDKTTRIDWKGMQTDLKITDDGRALKGGFSVAGADISNDSKKVEIGSVTSHYTLNKNDYGMYVGEADLSFESLHVLDGDKKLVDLESLDSRSTSDVAEGGLFNTGLSMSLQKLTINDKTFGPGAFELSLKNLDAEVLARINDKIKSAQNGDDAAKQQALFAILPELPKLLGRGAALNLSQLRMTVPQGVIEGNLLIELPKGDTINPLQLMQNISGNGRLKLPAAVLKDVLRLGNLQKQMKAQQAAGEAQTQEAAPAPANTAESVAAAATTATTTPVPATEQTPAAAPAAAPMTADDLARQVEAMTDAQVAGMVKGGLLVQQGSDFVVELSLQKGQFQVNGKPFTPSMLQF
ncbi:DUF945 domain-containing protein [Legionella geestiana]|nr:DUF945 domain-containing protein [Legionella geestiana]